MSEGPAEQHADSTERMPEVTLRYACTLKAFGSGGRAECGGDAKYIIRGHSCETKRTGEGMLWAACQAHIDEWEATTYPTKCGTCKHAFSNPLDIIWEVCKL